MARFCSYNLLLCVSVLATFLFALPTFADEAETQTSCPGSEEHDDQEEPQCCIRNLMTDSAEGKICAQQPSHMSVAVALTLILSFTFLISLQYFMNSQDVEMREYAYTVISSTVSIFSAVLTFQSVDAVVEEEISKPLQRVGFAPRVDLVIHLIHMLLWYVATQLTMAVVSKACKSVEWRKEELDEAANPEKHVNSGTQSNGHGHTNLMLDIEINSVCYGMVLAHLTGFASIKFWTELQQIHIFNRSPWHTLIPIPMALLAQLGLERLTGICREAFIELEGGRDWFESTWDKKCKDAEDDIMGLTFSVMIVNSLRYALNVAHGHECLPNSEQKEEGEECEFQHSVQVACWLYGFGVCFVMLLFATKRFFFSGENAPLPKMLMEISDDDDEPDTPESMSKSTSMTKGRSLRRSQSLYLKKLVLGEGLEAAEPEEEKTCSAEFMERMADVIFTTWSMAHAWCLLHGTRELLMVMSPSFLAKESNATALAVVLATGVTYIVFMIVRILDTIADRQKHLSTDEIRESIHIVVGGTAILIGFAWEQTFDVAVDQLAEKTRAYGGSHSPAIAKLVIGMGCIGVVFFAWKWYILPFVFKKGWRYGYVFSRNCLHERCHELATHDKHFAVEHLHDVARKLSQKSDHHKTRFHHPALESDDNRYQPLAESEAEALRAENQALKIRIKDLEDQLAEERKAAHKWNSHRTFSERQLEEERNARLGIKMSCETSGQEFLRRQCLEQAHKQKQHRYFKKHGESATPSPCKVQEAAVAHTMISESKSSPSASSPEFTDIQEVWRKRCGESAIPYHGSLKEGALDQIMTSESKSSESPAEFRQQEQQQNQQLATPRGSLLTGHRSPFTNNGSRSRSPVTRHQSPATGHRPSVTGNRQAVTGHHQQAHHLSMASDDEDEGNPRLLASQIEESSPQQDHRVHDGGKMHKDLRRISDALHARLSGLRTPSGDFRCFTRAP